MALTLESEQRLQSVSLVALFEGAEQRWTRLARQSHEFVRRNFPEGTSVRSDDVAKALVPLLEVNQQLTTYLSRNKLKQKYWIRNFCDLILDRCWDDITD